MGLKHAIASAWSWSLEGTLSSKYFPLTRYFPRGVSWIFDVQRFMGRRSLGVVFDVGANVGQTLKTLLKFAPGASIYCFEPAPKTFAILDHRFGKYGNVRLVNKALGSAAAKLPLLVREDSELNTLVGGHAGPNSAIVDVTTIDEIVGADEISHIELLKIDAQGWEIEVMKGAEKLIADQNLIFVLAETAFRADQTEIQQFGALHDFLEQRGFVLSGFYELKRYGPRKEFVLFSNVLYVHPAARNKWTELRAEWDEWMAVQTPTAA